MHQLTEEYDFVGKIDNNQDCEIFTIRKRGTNELFILKKLKLSGSPVNIERKVRFRREIDIVSSFDSPHIAKPVASSFDENEFLIIYPLQKGKSLSGWLRSGQKFCIRDALNIIAQALDALDYIHTRGIIHCDVSPTNVFLSEDSGLQLLDFGLSLTSEEASRIPDGTILGTPPYLSPEQMGFTEFKIDNRTDLFCAGLLLYELLSNNLPFCSSSDASIKTLLDNVLKKEVLPLRNVPAYVNSILLKSLRPSPDERYQTAIGFKWDLDHAIHNLDRDSLNFVVGEKDAITSVNRCSTFVCREYETKLLNSGIARIMNGHYASYLIWGSSGIGKTELVKKVLQNADHSKILMIMTKCNRFTPYHPYSAVGSIILYYLSAIERLSDEIRNKVRNELRNTFKTTSGLLCEILPELRDIFTDLSSSGLVEREREADLVHHLLWQFVDTICKIARIAVFLDDMQWIDKISLTVVKKCIAAHTPCLWIFCLRGDSPDEMSPFGEDLSSIGIEKTIRISPFCEDEIQQFLIARFGTIQNVRTLIEVLARNTNGSPFTIAEACKYLVNEGQLKPDVSGWHYVETETKGFPDKFDLSTLLLEKMRRLGTIENRFLQIASLMDDTIDCDILDEMWGFSGRSKAICYELEALGFLVRRADGAFTFLHDRAQEAILQQFSDTELSQNYEKLGNCYTAKANAKRSLLLNAAECFLKSSDIRNAAEICFKAALYSIENVAFDVAIRYLKSAIVLLPQCKARKIEVDVNISEAELLLADAFSLTGNNQQALRILLRMAQNCQLKSEKQELNYRIGSIYHKLGDMGNAIHYFSHTLTDLGRGFPRSRLNAKISLLLGLIQHGLLRAGLKHFLAQKNDRESLLAVRIYSKLAYSFFFHDWIFSLLAHLKGLIIAETLKDSYEKAETYSLHSIAAFQLFRKKSACRYSDSSALIAERLCRKDLLSLAKLFQGFIRFFQANWKSADGFFKSSLAISKEIGDIWGQITPLEHLGYSSFYKGDFAQAEHYMREESAISCQCNDLRGEILADRTILIIKALRASEISNEINDLEQKCNKSDNPAVNSVSCMAIAYALFLKSDYSASYHYCMMAIKTIKEKNINYEYVAAVYSQMCEILISELKGRTEGTTALKSNTNELIRMLRNHAVRAICSGYVFPAHMGSALRSLAWHQYFRGRNRLSQWLFRKSIKKHHSLDMRYEEAKSRRDYALFLEECNRPGEARDQFEHAYKLFEQCGAVLETNRLKDRIGIIPQSKKESDSSDGDTRALPVFGADKFRVDALFRVSASMTEIDDTDMLLKQIVRGMIEVTGAQYGCILLEQQDRAQKSLAMDFEGGIMSAGELGYSKAIVEKVRATREIVMTKRGTQELGEEMKEGETETVRSAMCVPLCRAEDYLGCVYLANNLVSGLFSEGSKKAAHILSAQAGILLENAYLMGESRRLNASLDHKVKEQTRDITEKNRQLEDANLKLIESERMKSILSGTLVHDIKNYAAGIEGNLQHLGRRLPDDPRISRIVGVVAESCVDIVSLASNLLDIAKMDEGKMVIRPEPIDIELMQEMLGKFTKNSLFEEKEIVPQINLPDFPVAIKADVYLLQRVFQNILSNAAKYVPRGGEVILSFERGTEEDVICFFNSGPAIPDQDKTILFEKYARLETARSQYSKGLGLFFCKMVMNAHGGRIWVDTNEHGNYFRMAFRKSDIQRVPFRAAS